MGAQAIGVTGTGTPWTGPGTLQGFSISSTAGADVVIYDSTDTSGTILNQFTLAAKGDKTEWLDVHVQTAVHITATAAIQGHVRIG